MKTNKWHIALLLSAVVVSAGQVFAEPPAAPTVADLQTQVQSLTQRLADLERKESDNWMTAARTDQIRAIVEEALADSKARSKSAAGPNFGYNNGFFLQTDDRNFKLSVGGLVQARYTFARSEVHNAGAFTTAPKAGNVNGFDFRRARLIFTGNAFTPDLTFNFTGDFAGDNCAKNPISTVTTDGAGNVTSTSQTSVSTDKNFFQIVDLFVAYRFNDLFNVRIGAFLTPFSRAEYTSTGAELVDVPAVLCPFDPARSTGMSVFGQLIKDRLSYEVNLNNGQNSNTLGRAGEVSTSGTTSSNAGANDNRLAYYMRLQYAGGGKLCDFADEPDLRKERGDLAWMVGGAVGYESANTTSTAFPSPQGNATIPVGTITSPGFASYPLNGDLYRGTVDVSAKYQGLSFTTAYYFQQINENPAADAGTAPALPGGYSLTGSSANSSFFEMGYYGQIGYMLTNKLEVVGRAGQFLTEGSSNRAEEFTLGLNYYVYGQNFKIQSDLTYIPNEAMSSSSTIGSAVNTQDIVFRLQLQLKF